VHGELLLLPPADESGAEACFQKALDVARSRKAKMYELLAAMSLARLWRRQGRAGAAWELLAGIYGWFTEGFDTPDSREAKALLDDLAQAAGPHRA
jgi:predicted ATPase